MSMDTNKTKIPKHFIFCYCSKIFHFVWYCLIGVLCATNKENRLFYQFLYRMFTWISVVVVHFQKKINHLISFNLSTDWAYYIFDAADREYFYCCFLMLLLFVLSFVHFYSIATLILVFTFLLSNLFRLFSVLKSKNAAFFLKFSAILNLSRHQ